MVIGYPKTISAISKEILDFCNHIAGTCKTNAVCVSENYSIEAPTSKSTIEVLLILRDFQPRLMNYIRVLGNRNVIIFAVDQWVFERDVDRGFLGEALARLLIFPYFPLDNELYLHSQEILLKKRLILELLENLVLSYPELSYNMQVKPEYFMYEVVLNRVRVFPPMAYGASRFLRGEANKTKNERVLLGYIEALTQLNDEGAVIFTDGNVKISSTFITASKRP